MTTHRGLTAADLVALEATADVVLLIITAGVSGAAVSAVHLRVGKVVR